MKKILTFLLKKKQQPVFFLFLVILFLGFFLFFPSSSKEKENLKNEIQIAPGKEISGISDVVDPRENWINELEKKISEVQKKSESDTQSALEEQRKVFENKLSELSRELDNEKRARAQKENQKAQNSTIDTKNAASTSKRKNSLKISAESDDYALDEEEYIISGSFVDAVLMNGIDVSTGTVIKGDPRPIMLRITDVARFSRNLKTEQILDAIVIGSCTGNLSSERAECRLETLSLKNKDGNIVEKKIEGWIIGADGRVGIKGKVVDRAGPMVQMSLLNGLLGGVSNFLKHQTMSTVYPISPIIGQTKALDWKDALKSGSADGVSNALDRLAKYSIDRAEQLSPTVIVSGGVKVQILFKSGVKLKSDEEKNIRKIRSLGQNTKNKDNAKQRNINIEEVKQ